MSGPDPASAPLRRGSIWWVNLDPTPVPPPPLAIAVPSAGEASVAVCDQARAVDRTRLRRAAGTLSREDLEAVEEGIRSVPGLA